MKIFFDSEVTGLHQKTTLISIGLVAENNRTFYAEFLDYDKSQVNKWIQENVLDNLLSNDEAIPSCDLRRINEIDQVWLLDNSRYEIIDYLKQWLVSLTEWSGKDIEMWSDTLAWDWILFCEFFGGALHLPDYIYYIPFDLATLFKSKSIDPDINREDFANLQGKPQKNNALWDARVIRACYEKVAK